MIKLVIFDRDDTLNIDVGFTFKKEDCNLVRGAKELVDFIKLSGMKISIASNQSGVGEGFYSLDQMQKFNQMLFEKLELPCDTFFAYCPHPREMDRRCACRKPSPYLILDACKKYDVSPVETVFIGDSKTDELAAERAGCKFIHVDPEVGHEKTVGLLKKMIVSESS